MANNPAEKKKGIFGAIAGAFVERVPESSVSTPAQTLTPNPVPSVSGQIDQDILKQLYQVLEENNMPGYDYFEFRAAVENMKAVIPDEISRFKAAFSAVSSMVSADKLASSVDFYIMKLDEHKQAFEKYSQNMVKDKVEGQESKAKDIEKRIVDIAVQITKLNEESVKLQNEKVTILTSSAGEKVKIETVRNNFISAHTKISEDIKADKQKISTYLQGAK